MEVRVRNVETPAAVPPAIHHGVLSATSVGLRCRRWLLALAVLPLLLAGCGIKLPFLRFRPGGEVLLVGVVSDKSIEAGDNPLEVFNPLGRYEPLRAALETHLGRSVALDLCWRPAIEPYLRDGHYDLALLSPAEYALLPQRERFEVLAVSTDAQGRPARHALLVVPLTSQVQNVSELKGAAVAFGLARDARTHQAGLDLLAAGGVAKADLSLEALPLPGSLRTFPRQRNIMQSVMRGASAAGFVDVAAWEALPEQAAADEPTRDKMRVIGQTAAVPDLLVVASAKLDADARAKIVAAFEGMRVRHEDVLRNLGFSGFVATPPDVRESVLKLGQSPGG